MGRLFVDDTATVLEKTLDAASLKQAVIADNMANVNTPGFKRAEVAFEEELRAALSRRPGVRLVTTHPGHVRAGKPDLANLSPSICREMQTSLRNDGNNVDIDAEAARLATNTLVYTAVARCVTSRFGMLRSAITEGRR